jgi:hypothetical protein
MNERILVLLGGLIIGTGMALLSTYSEYKGTVELLMISTGVAGTVIAIYQFLRN